MIAMAAYTIHGLPFAPFQMSGPSGVRHPISAAIIAILLGILVRNGFRVPSWLGDGARTIVRRSLPVVIVLAGVEMNLPQITGVGLPAVGIVLPACSRPRWSPHILAAFSASAVRLHC
jgi:Predicted membrane protein